MPFRTPPPRRQQRRMERAICTCYRSVATLMPMPAFHSPTLNAQHNHGALVHSGPNLRPGKEIGQLASRCDRKRQTANAVSGYHRTTVADICPGSTVAWCISHANRQASSRVRELVRHCSTSLMLAAISRFPETGSIESRAVHVEIPLRATKHLDTNPTWSTLLPSWQ